MKTTLEFDPVTEQEELYLAQNGWKYRSILSDLFQWLRRQEKNDKPVDSESVRAYLAEQLDERSIEL